MAGHLKKRSSPSVSLRFPSSLSERAACQEGCASLRSVSSLIWAICSTQSKSCRPTPKLQVKVRGNVTSIEAGVSAVTLALWRASFFSFFKEFTVKGQRSSKKTLWLRMRYEDVSSVCQTEQLHLNLVSTIRSNPVESKAQKTHKLMFFFKTKTSLKVILVALRQ